MPDVIIYFTDNTHMIIPNVSRYAWGDVDGTVTVDIDKKRLFFNMSHVKCIGYADKMGTMYTTN
jgi:hypothetical protein